jgi:fructose/tagatose bisphosphate aldolase
MVFPSVDELTAAVAPLGRPEGNRFVAGSAVPDDALVDRLAHSGALGVTPDVRGTARWVLRSLAAARSIQPASIHELYMAMGRGATGGFTVPAMNIRMMTYDTARAALRAAKSLDAGAIIFEIARSEIGYTEQRPHEYAAMVTAAALREKFDGLLFFQGDHVQVNAKKYRGPDRDQELETLRALIVEEIAAGFYNIDIDTSTLVDLDKPTLEEQQRVNCELGADFTALIRKHEPAGITISVGGEIGEVGGKNSDVHELRAYMRGYQAALAQRNGGKLTGISKISVQTGTAHGGFVGADGKVRMDVQIDLVALEELSRVAREEYGLGGAVQHGASTLPPEAFDAFPQAGACEIHLATDFQNQIYEHAQFPGALKQEMYAWVAEHATEERKPNDTEHQFIYKARKKAIGPFKTQLWSMPDETKAAIGRTLEDRFRFLMEKLRVGGTREAVQRYISLPERTFDREREISAAAGKITADERKAEGLAD